MNVSCGGKENICEATITITFPCIQTIMKHDMNKFNLTQFECWIWNLINLQVNRKKLKLCVFPASVILNITNQLCHHFSVIFWKMCTFSYGHLFLVSIFCQLTFEKNQVHSGDLTHCKQTLQLIRFYLIKNMKGNRGNWLAQFKFPFLGILWSFFYHMVKFTVFLISLSSVHLFAFWTILTIAASKCKEHKKCTQLLTR